MKKLIQLLLCIILVLHFISCNLFDYEGFGCKHVWQISSVTGGTVNAETHKAVSPCTVIRTCSKCAKKSGYNINPTVNLNFTENSGTVTVSKVNGVSMKGTLIIPQTVIMETGSPALFVSTVTGFDETEITKLLISKGPVELQNQAFGNCLNLTAVFIPDSVQTIGTACFSSCSSLNTIRVPETASIGSAVFADCTKLANFQPESLITQENVKMFKDCPIILEKYGLTVK